MLTTTATATTTVGAKKRKTEPEQLEPELLKTVPLKRQNRGRLSLSIPSLRNLSSLSDLTSSAPNSLSSSSSNSNVCNPITRDGLSECFHKVSTSLYVALAPVYALNPLLGIREQHLDPLVMSYFAPARGVILSYYNIRLYGDLSNNNTNSVTFMWISVDFLIWKPLVGDIIEGYVESETASQISLLIHDVFKIIVKRDSIPSNWSFINGHWVNSNGQKIDEKLRLTIKSVKVLDNRNVMLDGSLLVSNGTDCTKYTSSPDNRTHDRPRLITPTRRTRRITRSMSRLNEYTYDTIYNNQNFLNYLDKRKHVSSEKEEEDSESDSNSEEEIVQTRSSGRRPTLTDDISIYINKLNASENEADDHSDCESYCGETD